MTKRKMSKDRFIELCSGKEPYLYLVKLFDKDESFYKVGVTSRDVKLRLSSIPYEIEIIKVYSHPSPVLIMDIEKHLVKISKKYTPVKTFGGSSECVQSLDESISFLKSLTWMSEFQEANINRSGKRYKANFASRVRQYFDCKRNLYQYQQGLLDLSEQELNILESSILECETDQDFSVVTEYINIFGTKDIRDLSDSSLQPKILQEKITRHYELKLLKDMLHSKYKVDDMVLNSDLKQYLDYIKQKYNLTSALKLTDIGIAFEYKITGIKVNGKKENSIKLLRKI